MRITPTRFLGVLAGLVLVAGTAGATPAATWQIGTNQQTAKSLDTTVTVTARIPSTVTLSNASSTTVPVDLTWSTTADRLEFTDDLVQLRIEQTDGYGPVSTSAQVSTPTGAGTTRINVPMMSNRGPAPTLNGKYEVFLEVARVRAHFDEGAEAYDDFTFGNVKLGSFSVKTKTEVALESAGTTKTLRFSGSLRAPGEYGRTQAVPGELLRIYFDPAGTSPKALQRSIYMSAIGTFDLIVPRKGKGTWSLAFSGSTTWAASSSSKAVAS
ncbi:hypothetical protein [Nocardioides albus]|uniref:Uncharacterized protein n=1 Tax=Nocardioides albus TaxID=1841 RepID=A0A7W5FAQ1_9ACTN|nr:hypothetical protein [Nocardioides albus]MBB3091509.1 hypothetical protein [Nocardioides albus]GGU41315.1 hypothetical protein GCM10007979_45680 [Nocardioides albus]